MVAAARPARTMLLLIRGCLVLAFVGPVQAQIISEIEVPQADPKPARKPKRIPRSTAPDGVTPAEILSAPVRTPTEAEPDLPKKTRPRSAKTSPDDPKASTQTGGGAPPNLPSIDAKRWCARISDRVATGNCVQFEERQREFARIFWESLSEDGKRHCAGTVARLGADAATNQGLAACVRTRLAQEEGGLDTMSSAAQRR